MTMRERGARRMTPAACSSLSRVARMLLGMRGSPAASYASAPLPAFANEQRAADTGFRVGQQVFHTKFGEGAITALEGSGADARAQIRFKRHGEKWLALAVAKLQIVES